MFFADAAGLAAWPIDDGSSDGLGEREVLFFSLFRSMALVEDDEVAIFGLGPRKVSSTKALNLMRTGPIWWGAALTHFARGRPCEDLLDLLP